MLNFLGIGAQKSGTTLLYTHLKDVKEICLGKVKEIHFFDIDEKFNKGIEFYKTYFEHCKYNSIKGEITPAYIYFDDIPEKIYNTLGKDIKFIVLLRNPIERAYSHYWMMRKRKKEKYPFILAIVLEFFRIKKNKNYARDYSYISRGFYFKQLKRYFDFFPKDNFKIILYEDFVKDQNKYMNEVLDFLEVKEKYFFKNKKVFKNDYPKMNIGLKFILKILYFFEFRRLEKELKLNIKKWKE